VNPTAILRERGVTRTQAALLVALAIDNVGSGLFLPLAIVYATRAVGLGVDTAGLVVAVGMTLGFAVPPVAGRLSHRLGPRPVVVLSQLVQGFGALAFFLATSWQLVLVGGALMAVGAQLFYCSVFVLVADVTRSKSKERPFALVAMVRAGAFGLGTLIAALALSLGQVEALRWLVVADALTFAVAAWLLATYGEVPKVAHDPDSEVGSLAVLRDTGYRNLMIVTFLVDLSTDVALIGMPVFVLDVLEGPTWLPGVLLAFGTVLSSLFGVQVVDALKPYRRTSTMSAGAAVLCGWALMCLAMIWLPSDGVVLVAYAVVAWVVWVAGNKIFYPVAAGLSEAMPPRASRAGYMATYQYAFTTAQVVAPAVVALFAVSSWLTWVVVAVSAASGCLVVSALSRSLPESLDIRN
jgi:MFS family permease